MTSLFSRILLVGLVVVAGVVALPEALADGPDPVAAEPVSEQLTWWVEDPNKIPAIRAMLDTLWPNNDVEVLRGEPRSPGVWRDGPDLVVETPRVSRRSVVRDDAATMVALARSWLPTAPATVDNPEESR